MKNTRNVTFRLTQIDELMSRQVGAHDEIVELLEDAAAILRRCRGDSRNPEAERAAWRIADAGGLLRAALEMAGWESLNDESGRGFLLPRPSGELRGDRP